MIPKFTETGAKDKNGNELHLGDRLRFNYNIYQIVWENYGFKLELIQGSGNKLIALNHSIYMKKYD